MKVYRKKSKIGKIKIPILELKFTQFQLYLDKIFDLENQEGVLSLIRIILEGDLILPPPKEDSRDLINRRPGKYFSDLIRLVSLEKKGPIYVMAGTHRITAMLIANWLYKTRDYLNAKEYDIAHIDTLEDLNSWRAEEFVLQKVKGSNMGKTYAGFDIRKYQKGFDNQFTAKYGGKRIFVKRCVFSWEDLINRNAASMIKRLKYSLSQNLIKNRKEIKIANDIINFSQ